MVKPILIFFACISLSFSVLGQSRHELSVSVGGGLSTLQYDLSGGESKSGFGGTFGLGYAYFFSNNLGLVSGLELALYNSKAQYNNFMSSYSAVDIVGDSYEQRYYLNGFEEKQKSLFLNIPIMLQYQTKGKHRYYLAGGARVGIPLSAKYESSGSSITSTGYYHRQNVEYSTQEFLGFGILQAQHSSGKSKLNISAMASIETGMKWQLREKKQLYTGIYFDYGLNNIANNNSDVLIVRESMSRSYSTNGVLSSQYGMYNSQAGTDKTVAAADKIHPMAVGLKLRLSFGSGEIKKKEKKAVEELPAEAVQEPVEEAPVEVDTAAAYEAKQRAAEAEAARRQAVADSIKADADAKAAAEAKAKAEAYAQAKEAIGKPVESYAVGVASLSAEQQAMLDEKAALLQQYPKLRITCEGHTCDLGHDGVNSTLGQQRAELAKNYLVLQGVDSERVEVVSKGASEPLLPNTNRENRRQNRRVEFIVHE